MSILIGTLAPFDFGLPQGSGWSDVKILAAGSSERDPSHFVFNVLLFLPLGALLHHRLKGRSVSTVPVILVAGGSALVIATTVESIQAFLPSRDSSLLDVAANTIGAMVGVGADRTLGPSLVSWVNRLRLRTSTRALVIVMGCVLALILSTSAILQARTRLSNWSADYPLLIGNEGTGDRPWSGRVLSLTVTDRATSLAAMRRFAGTGSLAPGGEPIAVFDLRGAAPFADAAGNLPELEATGGAAHRGNWLATEGPASTLARRLGETNAFTLVVRCLTDDVNQAGPARIVSNSIDSSLRNFTLGQQGSDLVFRLRTPGTGVNGYPMEIVVPGVFSRAQLQDIVATYDGATVLIATSRSSQVWRSDLTPGASAALAVPELNVQLSELPVYELAYVAVMSLMPAGLVALLGRSVRQRGIVGSGWVVAFAALLETTLVRSSGRAFDLQNVVMTAAVASCVFIVLGCSLVQPASRKYCA